MAEFVLGLTGGIGSGKSAAESMFREYGITCIDADHVAREVVQPNEPALAAVSDHFGDTILLTNGALDRAALRELIFQDPTEKQWLESLLHPLIRQRIEQQLTEATSPYAILSSPLLIESKQSELVRRVCVVDVAETIQLERACARDNNSEEQIRRIMGSQLSREDRLSHADDVLNNEHSLDALSLQVKRLDALYRTLSSN